MKYKFTYILLLSFLIHSCKTSSVKEKDNYLVNACASSIITNDKQITWSLININEANTVLNQVRYCRYNPDVLGKLLYLELRHWNGIYVNKDEESVVTFWNNITGEGIDKVFSYSTTSYYDAWSSVAVYGDKNNDQLAPESQYGGVLLKNFRNKIKTYDTKVKPDYQ